MNETVVLLAVTKMLSGFCIAGIDERGKWSRPTKAGSTLLLGDVSYRDRTLMQPFDRVAFEVEREAPDPPHVEDRICDFIRQRPERLGQLSAVERAEFLALHAEKSAEPILDGKRSLALMRPEKIGALFKLDGYTGRYEARIRVPDVGDEHGLPCTDLRWRALGRTLLPPGGGTRTLTNAEIRRPDGARQVYLALGLSRQLNGTYTPLVVGVHLIPDFEATVDPKNP